MIADIAVGIFLLAGILAGIRLVRGPSLADRVISLDAALVALMGAIGTRVAETGDSTAGSVGLGLTICHGIVQSLGGRIALDNRMFQGRTTGLDARVQLALAPEAPFTLPTDPRSTTA